MPAPTTVSEFTDLVLKSGVIESERLTAYLEERRARGPTPDRPADMAAAMIRDGLITSFQAEQLLLGKWKRFTIGKYRVLERIGSGGMGQVFLCEHKLMRRCVAVKVLPSAKAEDASALERFYREARAVASLDHPNLVRAHDIDQEDSLHFLVMEYIDGTNLYELVKRSGPLDPIRACHYIYQAAQGLQHAFDFAGLVHRDIKPANLLVDRNGVIKILDMGLARFFFDEDDMLTRKYDETLGTADYLAPEQAIDSHCVDIRADIYSLGATFYYLLTGTPPFADGTVAQKLMWHQTREPEAVRSRRPDVPEAIAAILERMMRKDAAQRYQSPAEVAAALEPFVQTPIAPPTDAELPALCPAARATTAARAGGSGQVRRPNLRAHYAGGGVAVAAPPAAARSGPLAARGSKSPQPTAGQRDVYASAVERMTKIDPPAAPATRSNRWLWPAIAVGALILIGSLFLRQLGLARPVSAGSTAPPAGAAINPEPQTDH